MPSSPSARKSTKTAWIYIRESTADQLTRHAPMTQQEDCQALAAKLGYRVERVEWEAGSARSMRQRKVWQHYYRAIKQHKMDAVLVHAYSRLHRNFISQAELIAQARRSGVE